ncbi:MAG TPA: protein kinase [Thermogutta sp.]|nr:protein kinase [Thermogutta sp.]
MAGLEETIRDLCHQLDRAIRHREARRVEDYLATLDVSQLETDLLLELIYTEFVARSETGESPQADEYYERFPYLKDDLQELFFVHNLVAASLHSLDSTKEENDAEGEPSDLVANSFDAPATPAEGQSGSSPFETTTGEGFAAEGTVSESGVRGTILGHYELLEEIGRGATAVVFKARDLRLKRYVALKVINQASWDRAARERVLAEAQAAAGLRHPHIVQIYEVGESGDTCFVAMEYLEGGSLADRPDRVWSPREAARLVERIARAVQYAHEHHILHRDLKPANVLLDLDGTPKIVDFGLAKRLDEVSPNGSQEDLVGTPSYMAPEQAAGEVGAVGPATDVYGLGAILYELLAGRPPFTGKNAIETLLQVRHQDPVPPSRLQPYIHRDLVTICMKCLEKAPERRYPSAAALADDLQRFLEGHVILARPAGPVERLAKWVRRHSTAVLMGVMTVFAVLGVIFGLRWHFARLQKIEQDRQTLAQLAEKQAEELRSQEDLSRQRQYVEALARAQELLGDNTAQALAILEDPEKCPEDLRDFAWHLLHRLCHEGRTYWTLAVNQEKWVRRLTLSPDGQYLFWGTWDGTILVWNTLDQRVSHSFTAHSDWISAFAMVPQNNWLVTASYDHTIRIWQWQPSDEDGPAQLLREFRLEGNDVAWDLTVHPDGQVLLAATDRGIGVFPLSPQVTVESLLAKVNAEVVTVMPPRNAPKQASAGEGDRFFFLPPLATSTEKKTLIVHGQHRLGQAGMFRSVKFSPQGRVVACGAVNGRIVLFSWPQLEILLSLREFQDPVLSIDISRDGNLIAAAAAGNVWLYNMASKQSRYLRDVHFHAIRTVQFSQDGRRLLTAAEDYTAKVWDVKSLAQSHRLTAHIGYAVYGTFSPDGRGLYTASQGMLNLWDLEKHDVPLRLGTDNRTTRAMAWSPDGKHLATVEGTLWRDSSLSLWDVPTRNRLISAKQNGLSDDWLFFTRDGKWLISVVRERMVEIRDAQTLSVRRVIATLPAPISAMTLSPDGQSLLAGDRRGRIFRWNTVTWLENEIEQMALRNTYATLLLFTPQGDRLLVGTADGRLILWDVPRLRPLASTNLDGGPAAAAFDPLGRWLAVVGRISPAIQLLELSTLERVAIWDETPGFISHLAFSPDGQALLSATPAEMAAGRVELRVWNVASGRCHAVFPELAGPILFAPDGQSFLSLDRTRQVRIWNISTQAASELLTNHSPYNR